MPKMDENSRLNQNKAQKFEMSLENSQKVEKIQKNPKKAKNFKFSSEWPPQKIESI